MLGCIIGRMSSWNVSVEKIKTYTPRYVSLSLPPSPSLQWWAEELTRWNVVTFPDGLTTLWRDFVTWKWPLPVREIRWKVVKIKKINKNWNGGRILSNYRSVICCLFYKIENWIDHIYSLIKETRFLIFC